LRSKELYNSTRMADADATPNYTAEAFNAQAPAAGEEAKPKPKLLRLLLTQTPVAAPVQSSHCSAGSGSCTG
jgi:hypothetical protein